MCGKLAWIITMLIRIPPASRDCVDLPRRIITRLTTTVGITGNQFKISNLRPNCAGSSKHIGSLNPLHDTLIKRVSSIAVSINACVNCKTKNSTE